MAVAVGETTHHAGSRFRPHLVADDPLFALLDALAPEEGATDVDGWAGLTIQRFCAPVHLQCVEFGPLAVRFITPAAGAVASVHGRRITDEPVYLITAGRVDLDLQVTEASTRHPVLYCALGIDPQLVRSTSSTMHPFRIAGARADLGAVPMLSRLDDDLIQTAAGFLGSLSSGCDRRVVAPLRMQELVYRLLQREQRTRLTYLAADELMHDPVAAALGHIADHLAEPLSVAALATRVSLSPSAFSRVFREVTGRPPHRYIKDCRLDRARELLDDRRLGVSTVAGAVGYSSVSHFIKEFRGRFGSTPGEYAELAQRRYRALNSALQ